MRIISNLLNNCIEACKEPAIIKIKYEVFENSLHLSITDNGSGISKENVEAYLHGKSTKHTGPGLGLSSTVAYMRSLDGNLEITSQQGQGTEIKLVFNIV